MDSKRKKTYIIGIAVALGLPLLMMLLFVILIKKKGIVIPKHYGIAYVDTVKLPDGKVRYDTIYKTVNDISLTNQLGKKVDLNKDLRGKILLIHFFSTTDSVTSLKVTRHLHNLEARFQTKAKEKPQQDNVGNLFKIISISVNPAQDNVSRLRAYADAHQVNGDHWWLLTGDSAGIYNYALQQLGLPILQSGELNKEALSKIILVDTFRQVRGYFNGLEPYQLSQLADDISIVSMEKPKF